MEVVTDIGTCVVNLEAPVIEDLLRSKNIVKPMLTVYELFTIVYEKTNHKFTKYVIEKQIEGDYYGYLLTPDDERYYVGLSNLFMLFGNQNGIECYINDDLLQVQNDNLQVLLDEAVASENFALAQEIKLKMVNNGNTNK